jgi:hypothetical protein
MADVIKGAVYDALTGELEEKVLNSQELAELKKIQDEAIAMAEAKEAKAIAAQSARTKLAKLGLTQDEITALGIPEAEIATI